MKLIVLVLTCLSLLTIVQAQYIPASLPATSTQFLPEVTSFDNYSLASRRKLFQRNHGVIVGVQRGRSTAVELGGEAHWRKISLKKPHIVGATANMEYHFSNHIAGYKAGMWMKQGRVNFTYGANLAYFTDFKGSNWYGINPAIGFRFMGLHLINGYNILAGGKEEDGKEAPQVNKLYMSLRYYFPMENKFTWDKKGKTRQDREKEKRKKKKIKEREKRKKEKARNEKGDDKRKLFGITF